MTKDTKQAPREIYLHEGRPRTYWHSGGEGYVRYVRADTVESGEAVGWIYKCGECVYFHRKPLDHFYSLDNGETYVKGAPVYLHPPRSNEQTAQEDREAWFAGRNVWGSTAEEWLKFVETYDYAPPQLIAAIRALIGKGE